MTPRTGDYDPIRILLVDDNPKGLYGAGGGDRTALDDLVRESPALRATAGRVPQLPPRYRPYFEVRWLSSIEECREFRNLTWALERHSPGALAEHGYVPEILALDYSLSDDRSSVAERLQRWFRNSPDVLKDLLTLSPLRALRDTAKRLGVPTSIALGATNESLKSDRIPQAVLAAVEKRVSGHGSPEDAENEPSDYWGCFAGALLLSDLADHPCAPVTITRFGSEALRESAPDVWILEWLMAMQTGGLLCGQGMEAVTWRDIVPDGVDTLRTRIQELALRGLITLDLDEIARLASNPDQPILTMSSRYGTRRLPTAGLFIDAPSMVTDWADQALRQLIAPGSWPALTDARKHAKALLATYDQETLVSERIELSDILRQKERSDSLPEVRRERLEALMTQFDASFTEEAVPEKGRVINGEIGGDLAADIRYIEVDNWTRKWTALTVLVRLLKRFAFGWKNGMPFEDIIPAEVYLAMCPVARKPIIVPFSDGSDRSIASHMRVDGKIGFKVKEVLLGHGLSVADRALLKHVAFAEGLRRSVVKQWPRIDRIINGASGNV